MTRLQRLIGHSGSSLNLHTSGDAYFVSFNFSGFAGWGKPSDLQRIPWKTMAVRGDGNRGCLTSVSNWNHIAPHYWLIDFPVLDEADAFLGERIRGDLKQNSLVSSKNHSPLVFFKCAGSGKTLTIAIFSFTSHCYITAIAFYWWKSRKSFINLW